MKAVVAAFNQEKALVGAFSVITNLRMELFEALMLTPLVARMDLSSPTEDMATSVSSEEVASAGGRREVSLSSESSSSGGRQGGRAQEWDR